MAKRADDPMTDLLDDGRDVNIGRGLILDKLGLAARCGAIEIDPFKEEEMKMYIQIDTTAESLDKRDRSRVHLVPLHAALHRSIHVILADRGTDDGMHLCRQVT